MIKWHPDYQIDTEQLDIILYKELDFLKVRQSGILQTYTTKKKNTCVKKTPKSTWAAINESKNPDELMPPLPDSHFSVQIFAKTFDITVVLIVAQAFANEDPNDDNFVPTFWFYIYDPAIPNPEIFMSESFPERLVRDHSIYILSHETMEKDENDSEKVVVNNGGWHHNFFCPNVYSVVWVPKARLKKVISIAKYQTETAFSKIDRTLILQYWNLDTSLNFIYQESQGMMNGFV